MIRLLILSCIIALISACATFRIGEISETPINTSAPGSPLDKINDLPIVLYYHTNYGSFSGSEEEKTKALILQTIKESLTSDKVGFLEDYEMIPEEHVQIVVIRDFMRDMRQDSMLSGTVQIFSVIFSVFTATIIPTVDYEFENYLKVSHIKDDEIQNSAIFQQKTRRFMGLSMLPFSPKNTINSALAKTIEGVVTGKES